MENSISIRDSLSSVEIKSKELLELLQSESCDRKEALRIVEERVACLRNNPQVPSEVVDAIEAIASALGAIS